MTVGGVRIGAIMSAAKEFWPVGFFFFTLMQVEILRLR